VAGKFELSRRRDTLSLGHHPELAALPGAEQDFWLRKAEEFGWSIMRLRREVRSSLAERAREPAPAEPPGPATPPEGPHEAEHVTLRIKLPPGQLESCNRAARSQGITLHAWAIRALEQAPRLACDAAQQIQTNHSSHIDSRANALGMLNACSPRTSKESPC
jgi:hypothetical protein